MAGSPDKRRKDVMLMADIAHKAHVSPATVSRAFNPALSHLVKQKTRERILRVASRCGYKPNRFARALSGGSTGSLAVIFPPTTHLAESVYDIRVIVHTAEALQKVGFDMKIHFLSKQETEVSVTELRRSLAVDGLIVAGVPLEQRLAIPKSKTALPPVVFLNSYIEEGVYSVDADNIAGGRLAADCFISRGHTALAMLCGRQDSRNAVDRTAGYRQRITREGLPVRSEWFLHCDYGAREGYHAARKLLSRKRRPTALFCASDEIALGALRALHELGLSCPADVSLIGFDNAPAVEHTVPPLTSIEQPVAEMAAAAVETLLRMKRRQLPLARLVFPVRLIERESVRDLSRRRTKRN